MTTGFAGRAASVVMAPPSRVDDARAAAPGRSYPIGAMVRMNGDRNGDLLCVADGVVALEFTQAEQPRRILEFLLPGDAISLWTSVMPPETTLRVLWPATIRQVAMPPDGGVPVGLLRAEALRRALTSLVIGLPSIEARVASFFMALVLRRGGAPQNGTSVLMPMSREEIADHLLINRDTLSRIFARFRRDGVAIRLDRHRLLVEDWAKLAALTPLGGALLAAYGPTEKA